jgi:hypothetical protein
VRRAEGKEIKKKFWEKRKKKISWLHFLFLQLSSPLLMILEVFSIFPNLNRSRILWDKRKVLSPLLSHLNK